MAYQGTPGYSGPPPVAYTDWITRVGAYVIDVAPIIGGYIVAAILAVIVHSGGFAIFLYFLVAAGGIGWTVYNRWILGGQGQSLGKRTLKVRLVSEETGQPIGTLNAFIRDIAHIVDGIICDIGYLFPLWDPKRQTLADKIMKTVVIPA
jgi:uncharacterized RDD family membrane protein YckC